MVYKNTHTYTVLGEPCLPGGKEEPSDASIADTALREAQEEISLKREHVKLVTTFLPVAYSSIKGKLLQCYIVVCTLACPDTDELGLVASSEVSSIHWVPLRLFLGGPHHYCRNWTSRFDVKISINFFQVAEETESEKALVVWGLTARLCIVIACVVFSQPPRFPFTEYYISSVDAATVNFESFIFPDINFSKL